MSRGLPPPELLRKLLRYEFDTGALYWLKRTPDMFSDGAQPRHHICARWNSRWAGRLLTSRDKDGYIVARFHGRRMLAHRAIWALTCGKWPDLDIDHINGARDDNRIKNLREVPRRENARNAEIRSDNKSGVVGVSWDNGRGRWVARIGAEAGYRFLGYFDVMEDAVKARKSAEDEHGYHENHGRKKKGRPMAAQSRKIV